MNETNQTRTPRDSIGYDSCNYTQVFEPMQRIKSIEHANNNTRRDQPKQGT